FDIPGFEQNCDRKNIICLESSGTNSTGLAPSRSPARVLHGSVRRDGATGRVPGNDERRRISFTLESLAADAQLPHREPILLITDSRGNVIAGHDSPVKWLQFQTLAALIETAHADQGSASESEADRALRAAQRFGRGEQNAVFEGYPARLSRDVGGQRYAV